MFAFTIRQIEVFLAVCEEASFRRAADRLSVSEAAVSHHIRALERQLDCSLFGRRRGARVTLLEAGEAFRAEALTFVERGQELRTVARTYSARERPIRAYIGGHLLEDYIRPALPRLASHHPTIVLDVGLHRSRDMIRQDVVAGDLDLVLMNVRGEEDLPGSTLIAPVEGNLYGVTAFAVQATDGLDRIPFILSPVGSAEDHAQRRMLAALGISHPLVALRTQFHDGRIRAAIDGLGITFSLQSIVEKFDDAGALHVIRRINEWQIRLFLSYRLATETRITLETFIRSVLATRTRRELPAWPENGSRIS